MRTYYIEEKKSEVSYIELRLLLFVDCEAKYQKITELLHFLNNNNFITDLSIFSCNVPADAFSEQEDIMSLSIDFINDKMRFKFWNGASTFWLYHLDDVFDAISTGRNKFSEIYDKYEPVTDVLYDFKRRWRTSIYHISYQYYPANDDVELLYHITFTEEVKNTNYADKLLQKIGKEITMLGMDVTQGLNFRIEHSFKTSGCVPCQKAKEEREKNEQNKRDKKNNK